jgi:lia operon protein LiaG
MKTKKFRMAFLGIGFLAGAMLTQAQEYKIPVENSKDGKLSLENFMGDLPIEGYNGKEIIITSTSDAIVVPERAKGLKPIFPSGTDNTGMGLFVEKNGNQITITCLLPITKHGEYKLKVPENLSLKSESGCERSNAISIHGMKNEIEIKTCHSISLKDVTGPLVLSTIAGNIDVVFENISTDRPCSINSISGEVDVTLPAKTAATLEMKTISGTIFSDFDFPEAPKKNMKQVGGNDLKYQLNGGGATFSFVTVSGNVYLRKGK